MKICSFVAFMHIVIESTCMVDIFNIPLCGENLWYMYFLLYLLGNKMLHKPLNGPPRPGSLLMLPHFLFTCSICFANFAIRFNHYYDKSRDGNKKINSWYGWCAISRVQTPTEHVALLDILHKSHSACRSEKCTYCSGYSACCFE